MNFAVISQKLAQLSAFFWRCFFVCLIQMQEVSARLGVPMSCVVPVKNYSEELELDPNCDILLLSAVIQMLRFADNYFDEISDQLSNIAVTE